MKSSSCLLKEANNNVLTAITRALLVDDDEEDYVLLKDTLGEIRGAKIQLDWVSSFAKALEVVKAGEHDIYLFDYRLGERNGLELLEAAINLGCQAPIILLTGFGDKEVDMMAMDKGAADYLIKGKISSDLLERSIRYAIRRSHSLLELKNLLKELTEKKQNIRSLFDAVLEGVILHDFTETIIDANEAAGKIFGYSVQEMIGCKLEKICGGDCLKDYRVATAENSVFTKETAGHKKDGTSIFIEVVGKPYVYEGKGARILAISDITGKREMEAQILMQERLASVGLLASGLAHEIGTPLGVIRGRAELVSLDAEEGSPQKRNAAIITQQIDRVSTLIRSLLNLARGDSTKAAESVDLRSVVQDVATLLAHEFNKHQIQFQCDLSPDVKVRVVAKADPLQQVLLNLLVNSIHAIEAVKKSEAAPKHHIKLWVEEAKDLWNLFVEDSGCGISDENKKHLFTPFFTTKDVGVGTGLGLVNCYRIVNAWGGNIHVESQVGKGTVFRIGLPKG